MRAIPAFYKPKQALGPEAAALQDGLRVMARARFLKEKQDKILVSEDDLRALKRLLSELGHPADEYENLAGKLITYDRFMALANEPEVHPLFRTKLFTPETFRFFPKDVHGSAYVVSIMFTAMGIRQYSRIRWELGKLDSKNTGYLDEEQLAIFFERYSYEAHESFRGIWLATILRKFLFFLEHNRRISIRTLVSSPLLKEFLDRERLPDSWFNVDCTWRVYKYFISLDRDGNQFLSRDEMCDFRWDLDPQKMAYPGVSRVIVDRLFDRHVRPGADNPLGELDYRTFLDFVLAYENREHPVSLKYFWDLLDHVGQGYLSKSDVEVLIEGVFEVLRAEQFLDISVKINVEDVRSEVFDITHAGRSDVIALDDLSRSPNGFKVIQLLMDPAFFAYYEQREALMAQQRQAEVDSIANEVEYAESSGLIFEMPRDDAAASIESEAYPIDNVRVPIEPEICAEEGKDSV